MAQQDMAQVKALTFDVFGTVVDWRGSLIREGLAFGAAHGIHIDWASFADDWRGGYRSVDEPCTPRRVTVDQH